MIRNQRGKYIMSFSLYTIFRKASLCWNLGFPCVGFYFHAVWAEHGLQQAIQWLPWNPLPVFPEQWEGLASGDWRVCSSQDRLSILHWKFNLYFRKIPELEANHSPPSTCINVRTVFLFMLFFFHGFAIKGNVVLSWVHGMTITETVNEWLVRTY